MLSIKARSTNEAWRKTLKALIDLGNGTGNKKYYRDEVALIQIDEPAVEPIDQNFPMAQSDIDVINHYIFTGEQEDAMVHEWTKLYHHRAFDEPNSQIEFLISKLSTDDPVGEAQISMWDKNIDQDKEVSPCTQIIWARIRHGYLELHVHTNSSDAYGKLLMNIQEFVSLQTYIAGRVSVPVGKYIMFLDSCHIYSRDARSVETIVASRS